jgi:hypothetical protein
MVIAAGEHLVDQGIVAIVESPPMAHPATRLRM